MIHRPYEGTRAGAERDSSARRAARGRAGAAICNNSDPVVMDEPTTALLLTESEKVFR